LTFDDVTKASTRTIHNGYGDGLHWTHFGVVDPIAYGQGVGCGEANGYVNGRVSGAYVAYSPLGGLAEVTAPAGWTFDFISVYVTAADDKTFTAYGYKDGVELYRESLVINVNGPQLFTANFLGVDRVKFDSRGGCQFYSPLGDTFALDDFTYRRNLPAK
jgi:hypothetical protein